jgi:hypothetical protein
MTLDWKMCYLPKLLRGPMGWFEGKSLKLYIWFSQWNSGFPGVIFSTNPQGSGSGGMNAGLKASEMVELLNVAQEMGFIEMSAWWMIMICPCNIYNIYIYNRILYIYIYDNYYDNDNLVIDNLVLFYNDTLMMII